jgi:hypothetical protein
VPTAYNIYSSPQEFGLREVAQMEWTEPSYSFDTTVVWRDQDGRYYVASDSGCSCPGPFERITGLDELETFVNIFQVLEHVRERFADLNEDDVAYATNGYAHLAEALIRDEERFSTYALAA